MASNQLLLTLEPQEKICEKNISELDALLDSGEKDVFICSQCDKAFASDDLLREHTSKAHEGRTFPCSVCAYVAKRKSYLNIHERRAHRDEEKNHLCLHCSKQFRTTYLLERHLQTHTGEKPFVCDVCAKGFSDKSRLKRHQLIHSGERPFACNECGQSFNRQNNLKRHRRVHTREKPCKRNILPNTSSSENENRQDVLSCSHCELSFTSDELLREHTCKGHEGQLFPCSFCAYLSKSKSILKIHQRLVHRGEGRDHLPRNKIFEGAFETAANQLVLKVEPQEEISEKSISEFDALLAPEELGVFGCSKCDKAFTTDQLLQKHNRKAHEGRKFCCSLCDYVAKKCNDLDKHERLVHKGVAREHFCPHCNKAFTSALKLENHIRTHTGEKPFVCNVCAKRFSRKCSLNRHQLIHSGERPFAWKECGQSFNHVSNLKRHQGAHTGEKPYKCKWCDKRFYMSDYLTVHERIHTGEKPYKCQAQRCSYRSSDRRNLLAHQRKMHHDA